MPPSSTMSAPECTAELPVKLHSITEQLSPATDNAPPWYNTLLFVKLHLYMIPFLGLRTSFPQETDPPT